MLPTLCHHHLFFYGIIDMGMHAHSHVICTTFQIPNRQGKTGATTNANQKYRFGATLVAVWYVIGHGR